MIHGAAFVGKHQLHLPCVEERPPQSCGVPGDFSGRFGDFGLLVLLEKALSAAVVGRRELR